MIDTPPAVDRPAQPASDDVVARAGSYYRRTRYFVVAMMIGAGLWFLNDGFRAWPQQNAEVIARQKQEGKQVVAPHSDTDIELQRVLGVVLPPVGVAALAWFLYQSRGEYRLSGSTLHVPGHPPVPLNTIQSLDKTKWDRKGIAFANYELSTSISTAGQIKLDDFVYERAPTDTIVERIEQHLAPVSAEPADQPRETPPI